MPRRSAVALLASIVLLLGSNARMAHAAPVVPANFVVENAYPGVSFVVPTKVIYLPDGRALVTEKRGEVWAVTNGVKATTPMIAIDNEVLNADDRGLLAIAVDPHYFVNHYIYLLYVVDPDSNGVETNSDAFSRLTRYTVNFTDSATVIPSSRTILLGSTWTNGMPSCSPSHSIGDLEWGADGSLLVSVGDGADFNQTDSGGLEPGSFGTGKADPYEDIGAFRAQSLSSLDGKILRIDPATGWGYASNPWYDGNLQSKRSRIWCYGLRNPFRFTVRPGTGVTDPAAGNPGTLFIGDVGWNTWEEQNIAVTGGKNFGWPCYEGVAGQTNYQSANPAHNGCGSMGTADNPATQTAPALTYNHTSTIASVPFYSGLYGNTAMGGMFYRASNYPAAYRQQYFFGDYGQSWVRVATVDANSKILSVADFGTSMDSPVCFTADPVSGDVLYISITTGEVRRIRYTGATGNANPIAVGAVTPSFGAAPLAVNFSSSGTYDPDNDPFTISWAFGDATGSTLASPAHTYVVPGIYRPILTVADNKGGIGRDTLTVTATGNAPFPSAGVLDAFTRANGPIGGSWVTDKAGLVISNNALIQTGTDNVAIWNATAFSANQEAWFTFTKVNTTAEEQDLMLKVQGTTWDSGEIEVRYDGATQAIHVSTYAPAGGWVARGTPMPVTFVAGDRFGARALADGTVEVYRNANLLGTVSAPDWPYASIGGHLGMTLVGLASTVIDDFGGGDVVFNTNTPPVAHVTSPVNGSFYYAGETITLAGTASDKQDSTSALKWHWDVELHHNTHIHFGLSWDSTTAAYIAINHDDGTGVFYREKLTVTDTGGLSGRDSVDIFPENDLTVTPATFTPAGVTATDSVAYRFFVRNSGRLPARISHWMLVSGSTRLAEGDVITPMLDSVLVTGKFGPAFSPGTYAVRAAADTGNVVVETNESNNAAMSTLVIAPTAVEHAPIAAAAGTPVSGVAPLAVAFTSAGSSDPDRDVLSYGWAFGDGTTGAGATTNHTYNLAGNYTATLTVTDGRGGSATATVAVAVTGLPGTFPTTVVLDNFNRANSSTVGSSWLNATGVKIASNQLAPGTGTYNLVWNGAVYGPYQEAYMTLATITATATDHDLMLKVQGTTYDTGHIRVRYDATLKQVTVSTYTTATGYVTRGAPISVTMAAGDVFGARTAPDGTVEVWRNGLRIGSVSAAGWPYIGNGGRLGLAFVKAGSSRLDDFGGGTMANAPDSPPVAAATASPTTGVAPLAVTFAAGGSVDPDGDPLTYAWDFGDGTTGTGVGPAHTYAAIGNYTAKVTVSDGRGLSATATVAIAVTATPPPFPTTSVLDNFNRADGPLGGSWVGVLGGLTVTGNQMGIGTVDITTVWNGGAFGVSQEAYVTLANLNTAAPEHDLMLKVQGLSWDTGHIEVRYEAPTGHIFISTYAPSQGWILRGTLNVTFVNGDRFGARARTDGTVEVYRNTTLIGTASVTGWPFAANGGHLGMTISGANGTRLDDFGGGSSAVSAPAMAMHPADTDALVLPKQLALSGAWPNPTNGHVRFALSLPRVADVEFAIYDLGGRRVWSDDRRTLAAGVTTLQWSGVARDGRPVAVGVYLARVRVGGTLLTRRLAVIR